MENCSSAGFYKVDLHLSGIIFSSNFKNALGTDGQTNWKFRFKDVVKMRPHNLFMFILSSVFTVFLPLKNSISWHSLSLWISFQVCSFRALFFSCMLERIQLYRQASEGGEKERWEWRYSWGMSKWVCHHSIKQGEESDCDLVLSSCLFLFLLSKQSAESCNKRKSLALPTVAKALLSSS